MFTRTSEPVYDKRDGKAHRITMYSIHVVKKYCNMYMGVVSAALILTKGTLDIYVIIKLNFHGKQKNSYY